MALQRGVACPQLALMKRLSKDPLILCCGPRRLKVNPIYSQLNRGGGKGVNNVHKFERWLRHGVTSVATTYGPITFGNQPCTLLRETDDPQGDPLVPRFIPAC